MSRKRAKVGVSLDARCTVSPDDLRRHVRAWPQEKLAELVLECIGRDADLLARIEREIVTERGAGPAAACLRADVDRVLDIDFIEERQVAAYCARLDSVLASIVSLGKTNPSAALPVTWHFIETIPSILDSVHCEDELGIFCDDLTKATLSLAAKVQPLFRESLTRLLAAYMRDDYCVFDDVPRFLATTRLSGEERDWLLGVVIAHRSSAEDHQTRGLDELLGRLRKGRYTVRPTARG